MKQSASHLCRFTSGDRAPGTVWKVEWPHNTSVDALEKKSGACREWSHDIATVQPVASPLRGLSIVPVVTIRLFCWLLWKLKFKFNQTQRPLLQSGLVLKFHTLQHTELPCGRRPIRSGTIVLPQKRSDGYASYSSALCSIRRPPSPQTTNDQDTESKNSTWNSKFKRNFRTPIPRTLRQYILPKRR